MDGTGEEDRWGTSGGIREEQVGVGLGGDRGTDGQGDKGRGGWDRLVGQEGRAGGGRTVGQTSGR